jgi:hypothetical protein
MRYDDKIDNMTDDGKVKVGTGRVTCDGRTERRRP